MKIFKISLLILLVSISFNLKAQENSPKTAKFQNQSAKKFKIGLFYSLDKNLSDEHQSFNHYEGYAPEYNKANYSLGTEIEYFLNPKFSIQSGVNYANRDFTGTYYCHVCDFIGVIEPKNIKQRILEMPITTKYYFLPKKVLLYVEVGVVNQFILNETINENDYSLNGKLALGVGYVFTNNYSIEISTNYQHGISNLYKNSNFKQQVLGFKVGIKKRL